MFRILRAVHRLTGVIGALLILIMAVTGILLNHRSILGYGSDTAMKLQMFLFALHSGSLGNISIIWLTDLGAICMIVLSITGLWMWFKEKNTRKLK